MFEKITPDNVMMYAMKHYNNPQGDNEKEFLYDMKRFKYIKRLLRKYQDNGPLKERLILNHIICFYNVFDKYSATRIWFYKIDREYWTYLKTFLEYLSFMPVVVHSVNGENIISENLEIDENILIDLGKL